MGTTDRLSRAQDLIDSGLFEEARRLLRASLVRQPNHVESLYLYALSEAGLNRKSEAIQTLTRCIALDPKHHDAIYTKGRILMDLDRHREAVEFHSLAIALEPKNYWTYLNRGNSNVALGLNEKAIADFDAAISLNPDLFQGYLNKAHLLREKLQYAAALQLYEKSISIAESNPQAWFFRGITLGHLRQYEEAKLSYQTSLRLKPEDIGSLLHLGLTHDALGEHVDAVGCYSEILLKRKDHLDASINKAFSLSELGLFEDAAKTFQAAVAIAPNTDYLLGHLLHAKLKVCDWEGLETHVEIIKSGVLKNSRLIDPFSALGIIEDPGLQKRIAEIYSNYSVSAGSVPLSIFPKQKKEKIRIGYFSGDFYNHATMHLMAEVFELHNKNGFEIYGFSYGPNLKDEMRLRAEQSIPKFFDVSRQSDIEISKISRNLEIDIAVDLKGYTYNSRPGIFIERAAPIQISFLGFPGTLGSPHFDFIVADHHIIPEEFQSFYSEKIIYLPNCYQPNDRRRKSGGRLSSRDENQLPENSFVFCCFNNTWKITPQIFRSWMEILRETQNSVLWLLIDNLSARLRLENQARSAGISLERLIFADRVGNEEHLSRLHCADLFLDTFPYNAHTTASDSLWAGVPVLTIRGKTFPSRVASSLLFAVNLPELVTESFSAYELTAIALASENKKFINLKNKLTCEKASTTLFNTPLFTQDLEAAYRAIFSQYVNELPPANVTVTDR